MIEINKRTRRRTRDTFGHTGRRIIVSLEPGDVIAMRLERIRSGYTAPIREVFRVLAEWHARAEVRRKAADRAAKRKARP